MIIVEKASPDQNYLKLWDEKKKKTICKVERDEKVCNKSERITRRKAENVLFTHLKSKKEKEVRIIRLNRKKVALGGGYRGFLLKAKESWGNLQGYLRHIGNLLG